MDNQFVVFVSDGFGSLYNTCIFSYSSLLFKINGKSTLEFNLFNVISDVCLM